MLYFCSFLSTTKTIPSTNTLFALIKLKKKVANLKEAEASL